MLSNKHATILRDLAIRCLIFDADGNVIGALADFDHAEIEDALDALDGMMPTVEPMTIDRQRDADGESVYAFHKDAANLIVEDLWGHASAEDIDRLFSQKSANTPPKRVRVCTIDNPVSAVVVFSNIVRHTMSGSELSVMSLDEEMTLPGGACIVRTADGWTLWREETDR